ncbi:MAG: hypothetical protein IT307_02315 [Chloroflexi bacterium]|nr:hypothetical protein [Chloroflexota bacterium]
MLFQSSMGWHGRRAMVVTAVLLAPFTLTAPTTHAAQPVRVVGCQAVSLNPTLDQGDAAALVTPVSENGAADEDHQTSGSNPDADREEQQPAIQGSIPKPENIGEDDTKALTPLATFPKDQATANALAATNPADSRQVRKALVEGENGFVVWSVKTVYGAGVTGPDPRLEVKVDAGNGTVLSIECDPEDD